MMTKIDVSRHVAEMEQALRSGQARLPSDEVLATLERWQWDDMLDDASRAKARRQADAAPHPRGAPLSPAESLIPWR